MRDWHAFVRDRLPVDELSSAQAARVIRELAAQLEDVYRDARLAGASEADADTFAQAQVSDWKQMAADVGHAGPTWRASRLDRWLSRLEQRTTAGSRRLRMPLHFARDVRYALRQLASAPGFTVVAVLTLALGIGASTTMFSVVNGLLLRPLPYTAPDRLVGVNEIVPEYGPFSVSPANFLDWRGQTRAFTRLAAYAATSATFMGPDGPDRVPGALASADLFPVLGVNPTIGTPYTAQHEKPGAGGVIVLSYRLWAQRFSGDASIVGRAITVNGGPVTVLGVMPPEFYFPTRAAEFWQPLPLNPARAPRGAHFLNVVGRLADGTDAVRADAEIKAVAGRLAAQFPDTNAGESASVSALKDRLVGGVQSTLLTLFAAVGVVVVIACVNVANLQLVRAYGRGKEMAIRRALGASRARLIWQLLTESLILALSGGLLGVTLGYLALDPIRGVAAQALPRVGDIAMDGRVLAFAALTSCLTAVMFGLVPAWQASRPSASATLKYGGRWSSPYAKLTRTTLLIIEVALSLVMVTGACLLLRSVAKLTNVDPGFDPAQVLAFQVSLPERSYPDEPHQRQFFDALEASLVARPGVSAVGLVQTLPLRGSYNLVFEVRGHAPAKPGEEPSANYRVASAHYFETLRIRLSRGRVFDAHDTAAARPVAVVDEAFVRKYFGDGDALGQAVKIGNTRETFYEIVGIVGDVHHDALEANASPTMYVPLAQDPFSSAWVLVRTTGHPAELTATVRQTVRAIDPMLPAYSIRPLEEIVHDSIALRRLAMRLLLVFAVAAVVLAGVGLYGVMAYTVTQRTREIAVRMALGAAPADVSRLIIGQTVAIASAGIAIGLAATIALAPLAKPMLFEVSPSDLVSYLTTIGVLIAVSLLASYVPARRAVRVNPLAAMQEE